MDWSLVLASQDIPTTIERIADRRWILLVASQDRERALQSIRQFRLENRGWHWRQQLPGSEVTIHWGGLFWALALAVIYRLSVVDVPELRPLWILKSEAVRSGEWWRIFSAMLLHADLPHLLANITTGCLLVGLALARYGAGCGLLASYLAGAAGNILGLIIYTHPYQGLGASGMVMGALGLIIVPAFSTWRFHRPAFALLIRGVLAGLLLFIFLGLNRASDVAAHLGGFAAGAVLGLFLSAVPSRVLANSIVTLGSWLGLGFLLISTGWLALFSP